MRKLSGLNQTEAAKLARITQPSWSALERDETVPNEIKARTLLGLAHALKSTSEYILEGKGPPTAMHTTNEDEQKLLAHYRELRTHDQGKLLGYLERLIQEQATNSPSSAFRELSIPMRTPYKPKTPSE